jgi:hypothetical protein
MKYRRKDYAVCKCEVNILWKCIGNPETKEKK